MNKTQKFFMNTVGAAAQQVVTILLGFIVPIFMIKTYGSEVNGIITSITQCISYISLVEAGLSGAAVYSLYLPLAKRDISGINGIVSAAKNFYIKAGYIFSSACVVLAVVFAFLKVPQQLTPCTVFLLVILLSINGCVDFFALSRYRVILTADQKSYVLSYFRIFQDIFKIAIVVICSYAKINVVILHLLALLPIVGKIIGIYMFCKHNYPYLSFDKKPNVAALGRRYDVIYQQILGTVQFGTPTILATVFLDWVSVSVYSIYNMVLSGINGIMNIFVSGLPAGFGEVIATGDKRTLQTSASQFEVAYYSILSITYGLTMVLFLPFITVYTRDLSDAQYYLPILAFLVVVNGIVYSIKTPQSMLMIAAGMYKEQRWRSTIQAVIIVGGGILLAIPCNLYGIMIASIISNVYRTVDLIFYVSKHITKLPIMRTVRRMFQVCLNIFVIYCPAFWLSLNPSGYIEWIIIALFHGLFAVALVTLSFWITDKKDFLALIHRIKSIFHKGKKANDLKR